MEPWVAVSETILFELRDAEVEQLEQRAAVGSRGQEQIRRLQIAMHDAGRVGLGQRLARLQHIGDGLRYRQRAALLDDALQVAPRQVLHHDVGQTLFQVSYVVDLRHVVAAESCGNARLALEARQDVLARRVAVRLHELDGNPAVQA